MLIGYRGSLPVYTYFKSHHENHRKLVPVLRGRSVIGFKEVLEDVSPPAPAFLPLVHHLPERKGFGWLEYTDERREIARAHTKRGPHRREMMNG